VQEQVIIQGSTTETEYNAGTTVRLTATANEGWVFAGWSGDIESEDLVIEVSIEKGTSVSALFKRDSFELNITIEGEGTVKEEVIVQPGQYDYETVVRLTAVPADGWDFEGWSGDLESEDLVIEVLIDQVISINVLFSRQLFVSKSPVYNYPTNTSGEIISNYFFPGDIMIQNQPWKLFKNQTNNSFVINGQNYAIVESGINFIDIKNDGLLDMVGFLSHVNFDTTTGYFFILRDIYGEKEFEYYSTESWVVPRYDINDFNSDGILDVAAYTSNSHGDINGVYRTEDLPIKLYLFNPDGTFDSKYIGAPYSLHDGASGDVDNDGDIDILLWGSKGPFPPNDIGILENDGNANFIFKQQNITINNPKINKSFQSLAHRFIDLNNDGCLDIIAGCFFDEDWVSSQQTLAFGEEGYGAFNYSVYWGNCTGNYTFDLLTSSKTTVLPNNMVNNIDTVLNFNVLGQNFLDIDEDGDLDIISTLATQQYSSYYIQILINQGDKSFIDKTGELMESNFGEGVFYRTRIYDIDDDGDYDIIPTHRDDLTISLYWENIDGSFVKRTLN
jgi:hypothetical protein